MPVTYHPIPETLEAAVAQLESGLTVEERKVIADPSFISMSHHGVGMGLRNEWGLWSGSPLREHFKSVYGLGHADDMSGIILEALQSSVVGTPFDAHAKARHYQEYWQKQNIDPLHPEIDAENAKRQPA